MKFAYADPPYFGCGKLYKEHPNWADCDSLEWHKALIDKLVNEYPDGWALSMTSGNLHHLLPLVPKNARVAAWVKPFAIFGIDATVQNRVGAEEYGLYFSLLNLSFLFNIVMDLGINNYTTKNIARYPHIVSQYIGKIFSFRLILFAFYAIVTLSIGVGIGYRGEQLYLLLILIFNQWLVTFIAYFRSHFGGLHLFKTDALISVLDRLLLIIICGGVLYFSSTGKPFQIEWFIWMQTICYGITLVVAFILLVRKIGIPSFKFNWVFMLAPLRGALLCIQFHQITHIDFSDIFDVEYNIALKIRILSASCTF